MGGSIVIDHGAVDVEAAEWSEFGQGYRCSACGAHRVTRDLLAKHVRVCADREADDRAGQASLARWSA